MAWCWPQPTIRYFYLAWLTNSSYQKAEKKIVKKKKKEKNWKKKKKTH